MGWTTRYYCNAVFVVVNGR